MVETQVMYYVVSSRLSYAMRGERRNPLNGTVYAVFSTWEKASAYIQDNKMGLYARIVEQ
jgi:hypothetical protein